MSKENAMNKKSLLGLILFACLITAALFAATTFLIGKDIRSDIKSGQISVTEEKTASPQEGKQDIKALPSSVEDAETADASENEERQSPAKDTEAQEEETTETYSTSIEVSAPELICDSKSVDYLSFIPEMVIDSQLEANLDISNPDIEVDATAAILFDADTGEVIYYKNAVQAMFPASTAKLLTALVALEWCDEEEEVTVGDEIKMIASDSTRAYLKEGEILTIRNLLAGMLLPSGNDAAYAMAAYVGRKSLRDPEASRRKL
jgi:D-alanyl-D-alanine carboxypeptidase (penicillin-binding protein 5/6)